MTRSLLLDEVSALLCEHAWGAPVLVDQHIAREEVVVFVDEALPIEERARWTMRILAILDPTFVCTRSRTRVTVRRWGELRPEGQPSFVCRGTP